MQIGQSKDGMDIIISGYGVTSQRKRDSGTLRIVETTIGKIDSSNKEFHSSRDDKGACFGDSGGPVYIKEGGHIKVIGATSRGSYCDRGDGIYSDVGLHKDWIVSAFEELGAPYGEPTPVSVVAGGDVVDSNESGSSLDPSANVNGGENIVDSSNGQLKVAVEDGVKGSYLWVSASPFSEKTEFCINDRVCSEQSTRYSTEKFRSENKGFAFYRSANKLSIKNSISLTIINYLADGTENNRRTVNLKPNN